MSSPTWRRRRQSASRVWRQLRSDRAALAGLILLVFFVTDGADCAAVRDRSELAAVAGRNNPDLAPPSSEFWLGTDEIGRDVFAQVVWGARVSLYIGLLATVVAVVIGSVSGLIAGYAKGWISRVMLRDRRLLPGPAVHSAGDRVGNAARPVADRDGLGDRRHLLGRQARD